VLQESDLVPYSSSPLPQGPYLIFSPHPDDETFGMGGTIALAAEAGIPIHVIVMTDGAAGGDARTRKREIEAAGRILGISRTSFLALPDRGLHQAKIPFDRIAEISGNVRPGTVFLPALQEFHPDHRATTAAILPNLKRLPFAGSIWFYEISRHNEINRLIDITGTVRKKTDAIRCYASQLSQNKYEAVVLGLNQARSYTLGAEATHAEGFWACKGLDQEAILDQLRRALNLYFPVQKRRIIDFFRP
jgi:LmbE family N-acetylglucosaminyl deacetylase